MDKTGEDWNGLHLVKFEKKNRQPTFFQIYGMSVYTRIKMSFTQLENHSQLLQLYVAMILQMKDSWSANLTFRAHY